jgi:hypothetical protein
MDGKFGCNRSYRSCALLSGKAIEIAITRRVYEQENCIYTNCNWVGFASS